MSAPLTSPPADGLREEVVGEYYAKMANWQEAFAADMAQLRQDVFDPENNEDVQHADAIHRLLLERQDLTESERMVAALSMGISYGIALALKDPDPMEEDDYETA
jgi:hypothetical protein